eukprot:4632213-Amphidinium_carterae.1
MLVTATVARKCASQRVGWCARISDCHCAETLCVKHTHMRARVCVSVTCEVAAAVVEVVPWAW